MTTGSAARCGNSTPQIANNQIQVLLRCRQAILHHPSHQVTRFWFRARRRSLHNIERVAQDAFSFEDMAGLSQIHGSRSIRLLARLDAIAPPIPQV